MDHVVYYTHTNKRSMAIPQMNQINYHILNDSFYGMCLFVSPLDITEYSLPKTPHYSLHIIIKCI